ncbi:MAG: citramalate synthase [Solirubrobacterales bacterium]
MQIQLYDTTLRDGMQGPGMSVSAGEKLRIARTLDELGIPFLECGFPGSNPKDAEFFRLLEAERFEQATVVAFGMTRRRGVTPGDDEALVGVARSFAPAVCLVGKTWPLHLEKVTKVSPEENLEMIVGSVALCREAGKRVIYDAEHFFDAWHADSDYALRCLQAAADGGAENVTLCDTNGAKLPHEISEITAAVLRAMPSDVTIGIHAHDDAGCGVANSLAGVRAGATLVQGTANGYGERTGNANLTSILPALQLKMDLQCVRDDQLAHLTAASHRIAELCNVAPAPDQPYVGRNAFTHKGGLHVAGVNADARTFEHIDPDAVGNRREMVVSELSGRGTVHSRAATAGVELDDGAAERVLERLKDREHRGYHYEAAGASFELLLRRETGAYTPLFELESFRVIVEKPAQGRVQTEATIKIRVGDQRYVRTAEGNGPVNALDSALRDAIGAHHPELAGLELVNYRVRILDEAHGTGAVTRVLLDTTDGRDSWGTIGVSENIIEASWEALVDSLEHAFQSRPAAASGQGR